MITGGLHGQCLVGSGQGVVVYDQHSDMLGISVKVSIAISAPLSVTGTIAISGAVTVTTSATVAVII